MATRTKKDEPEFDREEWEIAKGKDEKRAACIRERLVDEFVASCSGRPCEVCGHIIDAWQPGCCLISHEGRIKAAADCPECGHFNERRMCKPRLDMAELSGSGRLLVVTTYAGASEIIRVETIVRAKVSPYTDYEELEIVCGGGAWFSCELDDGWNTLSRLREEMDR